MGTARRSGEYGWKVETGLSGVTISISSSLIYVYNGVVQSSESLILPLGLCEKCQEKLSEIIRDGIAFLLGPDTSRKRVVVKVGSEVSDVGEGNSGRRKSVCGGGRADATVREKMSKMKNERKMQMVLS
ncbi:uncharacterized protein MONOS_11203 [Monocercomonoides exilis]|uniref:uncharacterized protein n=1 Tax=Monocercomonoides exilis TaxID=2049356 RepID=UPI00355A66BD|nr:hypothetical protein MONOS_11203 [Monocercomonoides exilis]|eukprot:MONOS_11203.1-p1 / transcript=MONOS_11203.1 / gene=MONOS_11203 / organism=Monocercomonoides_exilis_PA203 / gene_product=unspecified product / transcript_product=unspecified product / location=Mono_scaffold00550:13114-13500(-) / protein_length=129 / sequence_SO=supercontig / SO=protein_coding / is_pseudo=false